MKTTNIQYTGELTLTTRGSKSSVIKNTGTENLFALIHLLLAQDNPTERTRPNAINIVYKGTQTSCIVNPIRVTSRIDSEGVIYEGVLNSTNINNDAFSTGKDIQFQLLGNIKDSSNNFQSVVLATVNAGTTEKDDLKLISETLYGQGILDWKLSFSNSSGLSESVQ